MLKALKQQSGPSTKLKCSDLILHTHKKKTISFEEP